jgi:hypothetical protein
MEATSISMEAKSMATTRTRWTDERIDDLKSSVDEIKVSVHRLQHLMIIGFFSLATMMVTGFGAMITLFAIQH